MFRDVLSPVRDPVAQDLPVRIEHHALDDKILESSGLRFVLETGQCPAGRPFDGKRPDQALRINDFQAACRHGVLGLEQRETPCSVEHLHLALNGKRDGLGNLGNLGESIEQCIEIKPCPANENQRSIRNDLID